MGIITLISDFGTFYPAVMKAVILSIAPDVTIVDVTHDISPQNVREAAFILRETVKYFPRGTTHIAVVDPTVGTGRRALVIEAAGHYLVGPDNGLLIPAARFLGNFEAMCIQAAPTSSTFHGRDIFAPVGAHISLGQLPSLEPAPACAVLELPNARVSEHTVGGIIIYVDRFGNCVTNINGTLLIRRHGYGSTYRLNGSVAVPFVRTYDEVAHGHPLLTVGSFNLIEVSINRGDAATELSLNSGDTVTLDRL